MLFSECPRVPKREWTSPASADLFQQDLFLTAKRDLPAARRFLHRAINMHDIPEKITIDKSGANRVAIEGVKAHASVDILMPQSKSSSNWTIGPLNESPGRCSDSNRFGRARIIIAGTEVMHMIRKGRMDCPAGQPMSIAN